MSDAEPTAEELLKMAEAIAEGEDDGDAELEIDLSEAIDIEPFTEKGIVVEVTAASGKRTKAGNPALKLKLLVVEGEHTKRVLFENVNLTGAGAGFSRVTLNALGADIDWDHPKVKPSTLVGLRAVADASVQHSAGYPDQTQLKNWKPYTDAATEESSNLK